MSLQSKIEWTEATWNPVRGCQKISPGCKHCYAETFAERFRGVQGHPYELGFTPRLIPEKLVEPIRWSIPKTVFVNSMRDLFQDVVPDGYIEAVADIMLRANWHTYQVLTKRADRLQYLSRDETSRRVAKWRPIFGGVSVSKTRSTAFRAHCPASNARRPPSAFSASNRSSKISVRINPRGNPLGDR